MATVRLTWTDPNSGALQEDEIRVYRATSAFDADTLPSVLATLAADTLTYDDATASPGTTYYYAVAMEKDGALALAFTTAVVVPAVGLVYTVTIPSGTVGSDLTDFPVLIRLEDLPSSIWTGVRSDGGNIRAFDVTEATEYPIDVIVINYEAETGTIAVKVPSVTAAADTEFKIIIDDIAEERYARGDTYGQAAVWDDYEAVFMGGESNLNRAKTTGEFEVLGDVNTFENVATIQTFTDDPHQGIAWDRATGDLYTFDNNKIVRYDDTGSVLATNSDPDGDVVSFLGIGTLGHLCDGTIYDDWIVIPVNNFPSTTRCAIAIFDKTTLAFVTATNVSATDTEISSICYRPDTDRLYTCSWGSSMGTAIGIRRWTINASTGAVASDGSLPLDFNAVGAIQGIEWWNVHFWISDDSRDEIIRLNQDGTGPRDAGLIGLDNGASVTGNFEGICAYKDGLAYLVDPTSANSYATYARPWNMGFGGGGALFGTNDGYIQRTGLTGGTTFTIGVSVARSAAKQASLLTFRDFSSGGTNDRVTLAHRFVTPNYNVEMWDNVNSWTTISTPVNSALNTMNRVVGVYSGTTRSLFCDGVQIGTQAGITARDADFDCLSVGIDDDTVAESFDGQLIFAYLRLGALSADWIEAEHLMISDPTTFYSIV
jgi:hypothetical protein